MNIFLFALIRLLCFKKKKILLQVPVIPTGVMVQLPPIHLTWPAVVCRHAQRRHRHNLIIRLWAFLALPMSSRIIKISQEPPTEIVCQVSIHHNLSSENKSETILNSYFNLIFVLISFFLTSVTRFHSFRFGSAFK